MRQRRIIRINLMDRKAPSEKGKPSPKREPKAIPNVVYALPIVAALLISLVWDYTLLKQKGELSAVRNRKKMELTLLEKKTKLLKKMKRELVELEDRKRIIKQIIKEAHLPLKVIKAIQEAMPEDVWLTSFDMNGKNIKMNGYALNDDALADFVENLQKSEFVASVQVSRYEKKEVNGVRVRRFVGGVKLK